MTKFYQKFLFGIVFSLLAYTGMAQVSVTATSGTTGPTSYTTLKAAFDAINAGTHKGAITVSITGNTSETASAAINANAAPASYTSISVTASGAFTVSINAASPLINLNGATNVTIDGTNGLKLINNHSSGTVITFNADASSNTVKNTYIKGATTVLTQGFPTAGIITFASGTTTGEDNNTIDNCDIDGGGNGVCGIYSTSAATTQAGFNSGNTVKNCKIHDNANANSTVTIGLFLDGGSNGWTIQGNSFYFTNPLNTGQQYVIRSLLIVPDFTTDAHTVTGNFVGGNSAGANGTMNLAASSTNAIGFIGIDVETAGPGNVVDNNTVKNINLTYGTAAGSFGNAAIFGFIGGFDGTSSVSNNTVSNLNFTNSAGFISFQAIHCNARVTGAGVVNPAFTINNNTISNITGNSGGGAAGDVQINCIRLETSSSASLGNTAIANPLFTVNGNTITNISAPFSGAATFIRGIGTITTQSTTGPSTAQLIPKLDINNNVIHGFSTSSILPVYSAGVCAGIHFGGSNGGNNTTDIQKITHNSIYDLSATNTVDSSVVVVGISATLGLFDISSNKIYDLKNAASGATKNPGVVGITVRNAIGASTVANNFISLGEGLTNNLQIFGILQNLNGTGPVNVDFNTVYISGAGVAGNNKTTAGFLRGSETLGAVTTPVIVKDNIFYNVRTGGGTHVALGNVNTTAPIDFTSDFNNLYSSTASTVALWGTTSNNLATYMTNSGDANSKSVTVTFVNPALGDLHLSGASATDVNLKGTPIAGITVDIDNDTRNATTPEMGADEPAACTVPAITTQPSAVAGCTGTTATLTVVATGTNLTYQWRKGGNNITGANSASYTINSVAAGDAGNYDVVIQNGCGSVTSNAVAVTVNTAVSITTQPAAQTVCSGANVTFTVAATGSGTLTYQWRKGGNNITGATSATYTINGTTTTDAGSYDVVVTGTCGSVTSNAATLTVNTGGGCSTAIPEVDADITSAVLLPNIVRSSTVLRVESRKSMKVEWAIVDVQGRVVRKISQRLLAGRNDLTIYMQDLAAGAYYISGSTANGRTEVLKLYRK